MFGIFKRVKELENKIKLLKFGKQSTPVNPKNKEEMIEQDMVHLILTNHQLCKLEGRYVNPKTEDLIAHSLSTVSVLRKNDNYYGNSYWDEVEKQIMDVYRRRTTTNINHENIRSHT